MSETPQMTEKSSMSLTLVVWLVGISMSVAGSFAYLQADVATVKADVAGSHDLSRRMDRLEMLMCVTDDPARARACQQMGVLQ